MFKLKSDHENKKTNNFHLNLRLWFSGVSFVHLLFLACKLLTIDFARSEDPAVRLYHSVRWQLITCWFNLLMLAYYPLSLYCDWREKRLEDKRRHVRLLNSIRHVVFTSIILPTTVFADTLFWRLWNRDRNLIAPPSIDEFVPFWTHHCMHSVSLVVVLLDLAIVPRQRPKSVKLNLAIMTTWVVAYLVTIFTSWFQGVNVYPLFGTLSGVQIVMFCFCMGIEHLLFFFLQWNFLDLVAWNKNKLTASSDDNKTISEFKRIDLKRETKYL